MNYLLKFYCHFIVWIVFPIKAIAAVDQSGGIGGPISGVKLNNPLAAQSIAQLFQSIVEILMVFAVPIVVFFIIYAGFMYVTARGNVEKVQTAHKALLYAIIGGLLIIGANVLITVVGNTVDSINQAAP